MLMGLVCVYRKSKVKNKRVFKFFEVSEHSKYQIFRLYEDQRLLKIWLNCSISFGNSIIDSILILATLLATWMGRYAEHWNKNYSLQWYTNILLNSWKFLKFLNGLQKTKAASFTWSVRSKLNFHRFSWGFLLWKTFILTVLKLLWPRNKTSFDNVDRQPITLFFKIFTCWALFCKSCHSL